MGDCMEEKYPGSHLVWDQSLFLMRDQELKPGNLLDLDLHREEQPKYNMRKKNFKLKPAFLLAGSFWFLQSCNPLMMKMYGIKDPEVENQKTIEKSALKYDLDTTNIVAVESRYFPAALKGHSIPDAAIYDRNGKYVEYRQTDTSCNAGLFEFIPALNMDNSYNQPDSLPLSSRWINFRDLQGNVISEPQGADFYVLIYWAVWAGKLNKDHVKVWEDLAKNNQNCKVKVIKVNLDIQENWNPADREKIVNAMSKKKKN